MIIHNEAKIMDYQEKGKSATAYNTAYTLRAYALALWTLLPTVATSYMLK